MRYSTPSRLKISAAVCATFIGIFLRRLSWPAASVPPHPGAIRAKGASTPGHVRQPVSEDAVRLPVGARTAHSAHCKSGGAVKMMVRVIAIAFITLFVGTGVGHAMNAKLESELA